MAKKPPKKEYVAYLAVRTTEGEPFSSTMVLHRSIERVREWVREPSLPEGSTISTDAPSTPPADTQQAAPDSEQSTETGVHSKPVEKQLADAMRAVVEAMAGYRPLSGVGVGMFSALRVAHLNSKILPEAEKQLSVVENVGDVKIYGIQPTETHLSNGWVAQLSEYDKALSAMPGAILLSVVATFDSYVSDIVRIMLKARTVELSDGKR